MTRIFNPSKSGIFTSKQLIIVSIVIVLIIIMVIATIFIISISNKDAVVTRDATTTLSSVQQFAGNNSGVFPSPEVISISQFEEKYNLPEGYNYSYGTSSSKSEDIAINNRNCSGQPGASVHFFLPSGGSRCIETL